MKINSILLIIAAWCFSFSSFGQEKTTNEECGTIVTPAQVQYMNKTRKQREALKQDFYAGKISSTITVPVAAHIVRRTNGTGGLSLADLTTSMTDLNAKYEQLDVQFDLCIINYINDDNLFNNYYSIAYSAPSDEYDLAIPNRIDDKLNLFYVPNAGTSWSSFPSYKASYDKDWIIMLNSHATNGSTTPHEVGHWFNLYHTHQGGRTGSDAELVDGSNCGAGVGDEVCDTAADPKLSGCVDNDTNCAYTCSYTDPNGDSYTPDPTNLMSYSLKACRTVFSPGQQLRMLISYYFDRTDLADDCNCSDDLTLIGTLTDGTVRDYNAAQTITSTQIIENGADISYEAGSSITLNAGFSIETGAVLDIDIQACVPAKMANGNKNTNALTMEMTTRFGEQETAMVEGSKLTAFPNPFNGATTIQYHLANEADVNLTIFNTLGKQVRQLVNEEQIQGNQRVTFNAAGLTPGLYYASLRINGTAKTIKIAINR